MTMLSRSLRDWRFVAIALAGGLSILAYILAACQIDQCGYPLDDAWIHQTYARNLSQLGEWAFVPGRPSAGSTSPLWTMLLAIGYKLGINPLIWTFFLGWLGLVLMGKIFYQGILVFLPDKPRLAFWGGLLIVFEWHLVWAAASGMETILAALIDLVVAVFLLKPSKSWAWIGLLIGVGIWVRPDGVTLWAPALLVMALDLTSWKEGWKAALKIGSPVGMLSALYLLFNHWSGRMWLPITFFAKQAEYGSYQTVPIWERFIQQAQMPLVGVGVLLLPGFFLLFPQIRKKWNWAVIGLILWIGGYIFMYAWRLPVTYQHGRYLIPVMPVYFLLGFVGMSRFVTRQTSRSFQRIGFKSWVFSGIIVLGVFWGLGMNAYRRDVSFIQAEMVDVARWIAQNTESDALVAAHDIGALGYFGQRNILDLAGLITPEVIPFLRDQDLIEAYLNEKKADYLVTFPGWYPRLTSGLTVVYTSSHVPNPFPDNEKMTVYYWRGADSR